MPNRLQRLSSQDTVSFLSNSVNHLPFVPGSIYAAELGKSKRYTRFPRELEREYQRFYLAERHTHVRFFNTVMCALALLAVLASVVSPHEATGTMQYLRVGTIAAAFAVMAGVAYSRHFQRAYLQTANAAALLIACVAAIEVAHWIDAGTGELFGLLTAYSIGLYYLVGILYRAAVQANAVMLLTLIATLVVLGQPANELAQVAAILAGTGAIGGIAFRHHGYRFRRTFLERRLIGELAARDGLTGLKNRRAFDEHLVRIWQQCMRDRRPLVVMMIDADHFKDFNDRYGHQAGDETLQKIAVIVDGFAKRPLDLAARFGGEELALTLFDMTHEQAAKIAERLRAAVQELGIGHDDNDHAGVVTVSVGVAVVRPRMGRSHEGIVQLADEALYAAKKGGRNQVRVFETEYEALSTGDFEKKRGAAPGTGPRAY